MGAVWSSQVVRRKKSAAVAIGLVAVLATFQLSTGISNAAAGNTLSVGAGGQYSTIQSAVDAAKAGDTVSIASGNYSGGITFKNSGTAGAPITVQAASGANVTVTGGGGGNSGLVDFGSSKYITLKGITVSKSSRFGITGNKADNITIDHCVVTGSQDGGVVFLTSSNITLQYSDVNNNNAKGKGADQEGVTMGVGTTKFTVRYNKVHDNHEEGIDAKYESDSGEIYGNKVYANNGPNIYVDSATNIKVHDNDVYNVVENDKAGIMVGVESYSTNKVAKAISIYNNVIYNNKAVGFTTWIESGGTISGVSLTNNTFYNNSPNNVGDAGSATFSNNLFVGKGAGNGNSNLTGSDSDFVNAAGGDFHLKQGSSAIDKGSASGAPATDHDGGARPTGSGVDVGAYEYGAKATAPTASTAPTSSTSSGPASISTPTPTPAKQNVPAANPAPMLSVTGAGGNEGSSGSDTQKPSAATNLHTTSVGSSAVGLAWTASKDNVGVTKYEVWSADAQWENWNLDGTVNANTLSVTDRNVANVYCLRAFDAAGNKSDSSKCIALNGNGTYDMNY